ncbi:MAG: hypothetical protein ABJH68_21905, partial [Ilumatobacter sp.]
MTSDPYEQGGRPRDARAPDAHRRFSSTHLTEERRPVGWDPPTWTSSPWAPPTTPRITEPTWTAPPPSSHRVLWIVAVACAIVALSLATVAVVRSPSEAAVLDVTDAIIHTPPSTVAPLPIATAPAVAEPTAAESDGVPEPATGDPEDDGALSPLADLLGENYSAVPAELTPRPVPVGAVTSSIDLTPYPIRPVGLQEDGQLEIPDETEIGWYRYGATAGRPGAT